MADEPSSACFSPSISFRSPLGSCDAKILLDRLGVVRVGNGYFPLGHSWANPRGKLPVGKVRGSSWRVAAPIKCQATMLKEYFGGLAARKMLRQGIL